MKTILKRLDYLMMTDRLDSLHRTIINLAMATQQGIMSEKEYLQIRDYITISTTRSQ
jgi:hypothetical protein